MTTETITRPALTATRVRKGKVVTVHVTVDGIDLGSYGGARAERATAAIVCSWASIYPTSEWSVCLRADFIAAEKESAKLTSPTKKGMVAADWAIAVPVVDAVPVVERHREGIYTVRDDNGEASIRCEFCPTKMMNGAGTKEGLAEQYREHLDEEHDQADCRSCSSPIEFDDGAEEWVHTATGWNDCGNEAEGFYAEPVTD